MTNRRASEERECIVRSPILVRWKAQGLNFPMHKDSCQYLAPLRQIIRLKICYFQKLFREPEELSKIQNQRHFFSTLIIFGKAVTGDRTSIQIFLLLPNEISEYEEIYNFSSRILPPPKFPDWRAMREISANIVPKFGLYCISLREIIEKYYGGNI